MDFLIDIVVIILLIKWSIWVCSFFTSFIWYTRRKAKYNRGVENKENQGPSVISYQEVDGTKTILFRKTIMQLINGINKVSNNNVAQIPFHWVRDIIYKYCLKVDIGKNVVIYKGTVFRDGYKCQIDDGTIIGDDNLIDARGGIYIGENCNFSTGVRIWTAQHDLQDARFAYESAPVKIGSRCWVSSNVTILPGVSIGDGSVIASGAVVTHDCESYGIYGGVPAKKIGVRNQNLIYSFTGTHDFFL